MGALYKTVLKFTLLILAVVLALTAVAFAADPAAVPDPLTDVAGFFKFVFDLITTKNWWAVGAALTIGAVALFRKYVVPKVSALQGVTAAWITTIVISLLLAIANAGLAHQAVTAKLCLIAIQAGFLAAGGWQFLRDHAYVLLKLPILGTFLGWIGLKPQTASVVQKDPPPPNPPVEVLK